MSLEADRKITGPNVGNSDPGVGSHGQMGQMKRTILLKFDGKQPEVIRVEDPFTGYAETIVNLNGLTLTQAEYDAYKAMT